MELIRTMSHFFTGTYLADAAPKNTAHSKLLTMVGAAIDKDSRRMLTDQSSLFRAAHVQSIMVIQPVNFEADGRQDMCDVWPDMTVHDGKLVWSCRLEELNKYGAFVTTAPCERTH